MEVGKPRISRGGKLAGLETQGRADAASRQSLKAECPHPWANLRLLLLKPFQWMKPTHIAKGNPLYSKSTDLDINLL